MKKKSAVLLIFALALIFFGCSLFFKSAARNDSPLPPLVAEIIEYRKKGNNSANDDVSRIIEKYYRKGDNIEKALNELTSQGFKINEIHDKKEFDNKKFDRAFIITWRIRHGFARKYGWGDDLQIFMYAKDGIIRKLSGYVIFISL